MGRQRAAAYALLVAAAVLCLAAPHRVLANEDTATENITFPISDNNCQCVSDCGYSFDVTYTWCYTSDRYTQRSHTHQPTNLALSLSLTLIPP